MLRQSYVYVRLFSLFLFLVLFFCFPSVFRTATPWKKTSPGFGPPWQGSFDIIFTVSKAVYAPSQAVWHTQMSDILYVVSVR